jgi:ribonuclease P protein component
VTAGCPFPRSGRLLKPDEFDAVFQRGRRVQGKLLNAIACTGGARQARLGLTVSRKTAPRAVDRNRIKRQVRESFRLQRAQLPPLDIVISARPGSATANNLELRAALEKLWIQLSR